MEFSVIYDNASSPLMEFSVNTRFYFYMLGYYTLLQTFHHLFYSKFPQIYLSSKNDSFGYFGDLWRHMGKCKIGNQIEPMIITDAFFTV